MSNQVCAGAFQEQSPFQQEMVKDKVDMLINRLEEIRDYHKVRDGNESYYDTLTYLVDYFNEVDSLDDKVVQYLKDSLERDYGMSESSTINSFEVLEQESMWAAFRALIVKSYTISSMELLSKYTGNFKAQVKMFFLENPDQANDYLIFLDRRCGEHYTHNDGKNQSLAQYYDKARSQLKN